MRRMIIVPAFIAAAFAAMFALDGQQAKAGMGFETAETKSGQVVLERRKIPGSSGDLSTAAGKKKAAAVCSRNPGFC